MGENLWLNNQDELFISKIIGNIIRKDKIRCFAYNICRDHIHMIILCKYNDLGSIIGKIKAVSSREFNLYKGYTTQDKGAFTITNNSRGSSAQDKGACPLAYARGETQNKLWGAKFNRRMLNTDMDIYRATSYVVNNRIKHSLPPNPELNSIIDSFIIGDP